ncbi:MAG: HD domain-containing protein [Alphaproteobacteria bacterium]|nr:HD domain-containing protein [Alphaproteobacteria bacterium]
MRDALLEAFALKAVDRAGWVRVGVEGAESVAAHSWGIALLVVLLLPEGLDRDRALLYAVLHDLAEAWVGDLTPHDGVSDKHAREEAAMTAFCARIGRPDLLAAWQDYESQADPEARFVKQLDRLDMGLQAAIYAKQGLDLAEFRASALAGITDPELRALLD